MSSNSFALALAFIASSFSLPAYAHPGAKAGETERTVEIKSTCQAENKQTHQTYVVGYTTPTAALVNEACPSGYAIMLYSFPVEQASNQAAEATGDSIFRSTPSRFRLGDGKVYSVRHEVRFIESDRYAITQSVGEARMTEIAAKLRLATPENPIKASFSYVSKSMTDLTRSSTATERTLRIVAVCESRGEKYGYLVAGAPKTAAKCPEPYQFRLSAVESAAPMSWFNYVDEAIGPMTNAYFVEINSQFGVNLIKSEVSGASFTKTQRDLLTASGAHPVNVTIDLTSTAVLSISPTVSPYAL